MWFLPVVPAQGGAGSTTTLYIAPHFEVRDHDVPVKYILNGQTRIARLEGSLTTSLRVQRLRLFAGWNLCSLAVTATNGLAQLSGVSDSGIDGVGRWERSGKSWVSVSAAETLEAGTILWLHATTNADVAITGTYVEPTARTVGTGGDFLPAAGLEAWPLSLAINDLPGAAATFFEAAAARWREWLPSPLRQYSPSNLPFPDVLAPGSAVYVQIEAPVDLQVPDVSLRLRYYHHDHLGSSGVTTDANGVAVEENSFYPFGDPRHQERYREIDEPYLFTQKERDVESLLQYFGARHVAGALSRFASPDPKYLRPDAQDSKTMVAFLKNPQSLNLYALAANNPLKYVDPAGLDIVWSQALEKDKNFKKAMAILKDTEEGKRILAALESSNVKVDLGKLPGGHGVEESGHAHMQAEITGTRRRKTRDATTEITIDLAKAKKMKLTPYELANVIHHELRHAEIHHIDLPEDNYNTEEGQQAAERRRNRLHKDLDVYVPRDLGTGRGAGVQTLDPRNADFQKEIGLLPQDYLKDSD